MKQFIALVLGLTAFGIRAQDCGRVIIHTNMSQPFSVSLNGVRPVSNYALKSTFDCLEDMNYKVKIWLPNTLNPVLLNLNSAPGYESIYILNKDNYGSLVLTLESKILMSASNTPTVVNTPTVSGPPLISDKDHKDMVAALKKESFDDTRMEMAKSFLKNAAVTSAQVADIVKVFSFEKMKMDFAKFAYSKTSDKQNYYKVYSSFNFPSSKEELAEFIKKQ